MRVFMIDPEQAIVKGYELKDKDGQVDFVDIYEALECKMVQFMHLMPHLVLLLDEEGKLKYNHHWMFFNKLGIVFSGKAIMCGYEHTTQTMLSVPNHIPTSALMEIIMWIGGDAAFEKLIKAGRIPRPKNQLIAGDKTKTIWEWKPHERSDN